MSSAAVVIGALRVKHIIRFLSYILLIHSPGPEVIKLFSCSAEIIPKCLVLMGYKILNNVCFEKSNGKNYSETNNWKL